MKTFLLFQRKQGFVRSREKEKTMPDFVFEGRTGWSVIAVVVIAGLYLGWEAAAQRSSKVYAASPAISTEVVSFPHSSTVAVVPVPAALSMEEQQALELARLEARTRRLEALVKVLRARQAENDRVEAQR